MKKCIAIVASLALFLSLSPITSTATAGSDGVPDNESVSTDISVDEDACFSGEAIVTLTLKKNEDSPLIHKGYLENDPRIRVKNVMNFGNAEELGATRAKKEILAEKTMYVSYMSSSSYDTEALLGLLKKYANVNQVSPNYRLQKEELPNDPLISEQWALGGDHYYSPKTPSQTNEPDDKKTEDVSPVTASIDYQKETDSVSDKNTPVIAIIDDGIDFTHEDLKNLKWKNTYSSLKGDYGYDFCNNDADPSPTNEEDDHGTMIAGIIAAETDNGVGIAGVSKNVKLMSVKLFDTDNEDSSGTSATEMACFEYVYKAAKLGVNIVAMNCSYGTEPSNTPVTDITDSTPTVNAILTKLGALGVLCVASSCNMGVEIPENTYGSPYERDKTYLLTVGSCDKNGERSVFSNYGKTHVDLMAPGENILTTVRSPVFLPNSYSKEKRDKLCRFVDSFDSSAVPFLSNADINQQEDSAVEIYHSYYDSHGDSSSGSAKIAIKRKRNAHSDAYSIYYDVTSYNLNIHDEVYWSFMLKVGEDSWEVENGTISNCQFAGLYSVKGRMYLRINLKRMIMGDFTQMIGKSFYLDDFALSVDNPDPNELGYYSLCNGTSFSVPHVCGAIARLAALYPKDNALTRKQKLLATVKKTDSLTESCSTGGMLNLAGFADVADIHVDSIKYPVTKIKLNKTKATLKVGKKLKLKASVAPDYATNPAVKWKVSKKAYASVTAKGVVKAKKKGRGHTVTITATAKDGSKKKASCKVKIK